MHEYAFIVAVMPGSDLRFVLLNDVAKFTDVGVVHSRSVSACDEKITR